MSCLLDSPTRPLYIPAMPSLRNHVGSLRAAAGLTSGELADRVGVSRQSLSAIEGGKSVPSTAVALGLARALACRVEDLFELVPGVVRVSEPAATAGGRVILGRVGEAWVAHALPAGGTDAADGRVASSAEVEPWDTVDRLARNVLIAGCAPVLGVLAGRLAREPEAGAARWLPKTSLEALEDLVAGRVHVAGLHLAAADDAEAHAALARRRMPDEDLEIVELIVWREGLAFAPGNPRGLAEADDLLAPGLRVARRPVGSGAALALDDALRRRGAGPSALEGPACATHAEAAAALRLGAADAAVLLEPIAQAAGLPFVPLKEERFELIFRRRDREHPGVTRLLEALHDARFVREVRAMGAYDTSSTGRRRSLPASSRPPTLLAE